jgi:esterase/lipase
MWSLETSKCQGGEHLAKIAQPALVVQSTADMGVFPSDARKIFNAIGAKDKTLHMVPGAHYFEDSESHRENVVELMAQWIKAKS